ncbi:PAS domain-containing hybrid sensor histidine kinase/response regulator [Caulobacter sp. NIBR2454]|uniref:PAS domain-containing hybrid sensor histidine kinase/response regulator n=1 Tax=Caulobacter sp. NIBR2454 TaxID=3015996 RepID=UPI0022B71519|nr:ATP-binding protein [Caulobacter sp. NIBR2454]
MDRPPVREEGLVDASTFFDVSLDLLVIRDLSGVVLKASRSWQSQLGHAPEEMEGRPLLRLVHPDDMPGTLNSVVEVEGRKEGDPVLGFVNRYRHKDGHYRTLEWRAQRFGDRIYGVARDVTDRVAAERQMTESKAAAEAANRAKSDFLANISHEIRTPLSGVIGIVDALSRTPLNPEQAEMVRLVQESGATLERLVSDFLDVSKIEAGQLPLESRPFDLAKALHSCIEVMRYRAEAKGLTFEIDCDADPAARYLGDSTRIGQIVNNLLSNAIKFTQTGGVTFRVRGIGNGATADIIFEVEDTGIGFDPDAAPALFTRFSQADESISRRFGGTGLGLSICRSLVDMMGGEITVASEPGVGSRFTVSLQLPLVAPTIAEAAPDPFGSPLLTPISERPLRVLLVEDHPTNQRVAQIMLAGMGAEVVTVGDGLAAIGAFSSDRFDVVLMDMQMPRMDGLTATREIRALEAQLGLTRTPVIMLSANALATHQHEAVTAGADLHVSKPFSALELMSGIRQAVA